GVAVCGVGALVDLEADAVGLEGEMLVPPHLEPWWDADGGGLGSGELAPVAKVAGAADENEGEERSQKWTHRVDPPDQSRTGSAGRYPARGARFHRSVFRRSEPMLRGSGHHWPRAISGACRRWAARDGSTLRNLQRRGRLRSLPVRAAPRYEAGQAVSSRSFGAKGISKPG